MTDPTPIFKSQAFFVIDVQQGLIAGPEAVPDALEIRQAISDILESIRQHNDNVAQLKNKSSRKKIRIVFVQHNDKDPNDPLHKGKPTWELTFSPRKDDEAELLVSKDVGNVFESNVKLAHDLRQQGITQLAVTGLQSDFCVRASISGAIASGFDAENITLLQGTHSTYDHAGRSYERIRKDVEQELAASGVRLRGWRDFTLPDV